MILGFYFIFNLFAVYKLLDLADNELDKKIKHEIEHIDHFVDYVGDSLIFHSTREFDESDFLDVTPNAYFLQIYDSTGNILFTSKNISLIGNLPIEFKKLKSDYIFYNSDYKAIELRFVHKKMDSDNKVIIQLATPRASVVNLAREFEIFILLTFPLVLLLIIAMSFFLSKRAFSNVKKIIDLANEISAQNISKRIVYKAGKNDVLSLLKDTLNDLFGRLENQISQIAEFTSNASHQLMSPLTAIKSELEYLLKKDRQKDEYVAALTVLKEQTDKMINIVKTLLILARESDASKLLSNVFSLNKLIDSEIKPVYSAPIEFKSEPELYLRGNSDYFTLVLQNLLDNALKYSGKQKKVSLSAYQIDNSIIIKVSDNGIGIPDNEREVIFDKFYRGSNSGSSTGFGLGLSLVKVIVKQMQGNITIENHQPNGTIFILTFPAVPIS